MNPALNRSIGVRVIKKATAPLTATDVERRIYAAIEDPHSTLDDLQNLYREARASDYNTYVRIDWGTMTIMIHTRWPNGMRRLIG